MLENPECSGTERNGTEPEVIDAQYGRRRWTRGQKLVRVQTRFVRSVTATKTGQALAESWPRKD